MSDGGDRPPLLLLGATGFVGAHLLEALADDHEVTAVRFSSPRFDARCRWRDDPGGPEAMEELVARVAPRFVVNASAMASIGACEDDPESARTVNARTTGAVARAAARAGARVVHLSTDQVFDGSRGSYREDDPPSPITVYGRTKVEGEKRAREACEDLVVLRLNLVYGRSIGPRPSSSDRMIAAAREGREIPLFVDEHRSPVSVLDAVSAVGELLRSPFTGTLHLGGPGRLSRFELGHAVLKRAGLGDRARRALASEFDGPPRSPDTSFDAARAREVLARPPRPLSERIDCVC
ncbi:MAG: SDR family oxidoreductase [Planctomycetota bacterium]|jgi:dTDP-4-dehydrorhamnose reductase